MSAKIEDPPLSQSHFAKFEDFTPNADAPFEHEFTRLASSQDWIPGSQRFTRERTIAMREEIAVHYFPGSQTVDLSEEEKLQGYRALCHEVGILPSSSVEQCKKDLKKTLVNIVDLIDARRTQKEVDVWTDFEAFRQYTLQDDKRIDKDEAKEDGGYLASLLQYLRCPRRGRRNGSRRNSPSSKVVSGRVIKRSTSRLLPSGA